MHNGNAHFTFFVSNAGSNRYVKNNKLYNSEIPTIRQILAFMMLIDYRNTMYILCWMYYYWILLFRCTANLAYVISLNSELFTWCTNVLNSIAFSSMIKTFSLQIKITITCTIETSLNNDGAKKDFTQHFCFLFNCIFYLPQI